MQITLADFNLAQVAKPVVARTKDVLRKRNARRVAAIQREHARKVASRDAEIVARVEARKAALANLSIVCESGRVIRPIKGSK